MIWKGDHYIRRKAPLFADKECGLPRGMLYYCLELARARHQTGITVFYGFDD
jgi:hypothetical protein